MQTSVDSSELSAYGKSPDNKKNPYKIVFDLQDPDDLDLFLDILDNSKYNIIELNVLYHQFPKNIVINKETQTVTFNKSKVKPDIEINAKTYNDNDFPVYVRIFKNLLPYYDYEYEIQDTEYGVVEFDTTFEISPTNTEEWEALYFAYQQGFIDKMHRPLIEDGDGNTLLNDFNWSKMEELYGKEFVYYIINHKINNIPMEMFKYVTDDSCLDFQIPNKYYSGIVALCERSEYVGIYKGYEESVKKLKGILPSIVNGNVYIPKHLVGYLYNNQFERDGWTLHREYGLSVVDGYEGCLENGSSHTLFDISISDSEVKVKCGGEFILDYSDNSCLGCGAYSDCWYCSFPLDMYPDKKPIPYEVYDNGKVVAKGEITEYFMGENQQVTPTLLLRLGEPPKNVQYVRGIGQFMKPVKCKTHGVQKWELTDYVYHSKMNNPSPPVINANQAIFDINSVKELNDGWVEVKITPMVKLKGGKEKPANSIIIDGQLVVKGEKDGKKS